MQRETPDEDSTNIPTVMPFQEYREAAMKYFILLTLIGVSLLVGPSASKLSCQDENGSNVDWFIIYKIPHLPDNEVFKSGYSYAYLTSKTSSHTWKLSRNYITNESSLLGQTVTNLYNDAAKYSYVFYNDDPPTSAVKGSSSYLAHAKGILAADATSGFWMIHSMPQFALPPKTGKKPTEFLYPHNAKDNGQTVLCISFNTRSQLDSIVSQLLIMRPNIYSIQVTPEVAAVSSDMANLKGKKWSKDTEQTMKIKSGNGVSFTSFVRSPKSEHKELYLEIVAPGIGSDLLVETWRRGAGDPLSSNCSFDYKVNNIDKVGLTFDDGSAFPKTSAWDYLEDHSKWAVTPEANPAASCIGDINRMASQYKRGGGTVCLFDKNVWKAMRSSIEEVEGCPRKTTGTAQHVSKKKKERKTFRGGHPHMIRVQSRQANSSMFQTNKTMSPAYAWFFILLSGFLVTSNLLS